MTSPPEEPSDGALAAQALAGVQAAYAALLRRHRDPLYRMVRAHIGDAEEALDVVQDSFVSAFAALARYDHSQPFRPWLSRIALNKCRDWARRRAVRRFFTFARPIEEAQDIADPAAGPDVLADDRAALDRLERAIATLPVSLKEPLLLCAIEQMSQADAARLLGLSEKAVELRIYRARQRLTEILRD